MVQRIILARGLHWQDGVTVIDAIQAAAGTGPCLVLVPRFAGTKLLPGGETLVLAGNLTISGDVPVVDLSLLSTRTPSGSPYQFRRAGGSWSVAFESGPVPVKHSIGMQHIQLLLRNSHKEVSAIALSAGLTSRDEKMPDDLAASGLRPSDGGDAGPVIDDQAFAEYQSRAQELAHQVAAARNEGDEALVERLLGDLEWLAEQTRSARNWRGKPRLAKSESERARSRVSNAIRKALRDVDAVAPDAARHLHETLRTGYRCVYKPEWSVSWEF